MRRRLRAAARRSRAMKARQIAVVTTPIGGTSGRGTRGMIPRMRRSEPAVLKRCAYHRPRPGGASGDVARSSGVEGSGVEGPCLMVDELEGRPHAALGRETVLDLQAREDRAAGPGRPAGVAHLLGLLARRQGEERL